MTNIENTIQLATTADMKNAIRFEYRIGKLWNEMPMRAFIDIAPSWQSGNYVATRLAPKTDPHKYDNHLYDLDARDTASLGKMIMRDYVTFLEATAQMQLDKVMPNELTRQIESAFPGDRGDIGSILYASKKDIVCKMATCFPVHIILASEPEARKASSQAEEKGEIRPTSLSQDIYAPLFRKVLEFSEKVEGGTAAEA
jgi:hypothetical protein